MMPAPSMRPTVGFMPTSEQALDGQTIEPSVSVPMPTAAKLAAIAAPVPELEPHGLRSSAYGLAHCPPRALQPLDDRVERIFAHSERFVLPRITAPAARSLATSGASRRCASRPGAARRSLPRGPHPLAPSPRGGEGEREERQQRPLHNEGRNVG